MKEQFLKKILVGLCLFLFLIIIILSTILIKFKNTEDIILTKDLTCEFQESCTAKDFIKHLNGQFLKQTPINTEVLGEQFVQIRYLNQYGYETKKEFILKIVDKVPPTVVVNNPYQIEEGSITNLGDTIFCADNYDDNIPCVIEGTYDLNQPGTYNLKITATDFSGNQTEKKFTLKVVEKQIKKLTSNSISKEYTKFSDIYQKYKNNDTMIGLDLSKWQGEVDFEKIKEQGVEFVMLKIGGQTKIDGEFIMDPQFLTNIKKALEHDLKVGIYFYSYANSITDAKEQAKWVINNVKEYKITLPIAFDWENWSKFTSFHIGFHTLNKIATSFIREIEKNNYEGMLYSSKYYLENIWYQEKYNNWLAYYTNDFNPKGQYQMWQLCSDGKIEGISGYVDINILYK